MRKQRTELQNRSLHKFCELLAKALNDADFDVRDIIYGGQVRAFMDLYEACIKLNNPEINAILRKISPRKLEVEMPWTKELVKEHIWRPVQRAMTDKESTTEINTVDPSEIWEVINRHLTEFTKGRVMVPLWPSEENRDG